MNPSQASVTFLVIAALAPCVWAVVALWRSPYTPWQSLWYFVNVLLTRILWRTQIPRQLPVPSDQGAIVVANHRSSVDPFFIQLAAGRVVHWMVAKEYFRIPIIGMFLRITQAIPTGRMGHDTAATRAAMRYAAAGDLVGIMPEGRINDTDQLFLPTRPGAARIALAAGVPVIPCYIEGVPYNGTPWGPLFMPARVRVTFGTPIDASSDGNRERKARLAQQLTLRFMSEMARLAGREDFHPQLAGRRWMPRQNESEPEPD